MSTTTNLKITEAGNTNISAFNNLSVPGEKISAFVPVDESGTPIHLLAPDVSNRYMVCMEIIPTALTNGLSLLSFRNPILNKKIYISRIEVIQVFTGTAGATKSAFRFRRYTGCTSVTGALTTITPSKRDNTNGLSQVECRTSLGGMTLTGALIETDGFAQFMAPNQNAAVLEKDWEFINYPLVLAQNEGIVLQTNGAIIAGATLAISIQYSEV